MRPTRTAAIAVMLVLAACSGSSSGGSAATSAASAPASAAASASPPVPVLPAHPAPAGFPTGTYGRTAKLQGELDGRWSLTLKPDGRYEFVNPQGTKDVGTFVVTGKQIIFTDARCGVGGYTFTATDTTLHFQPIGNEGCAEDRGPLLAGQDWQKSS